MHIAKVFVVVVHKSIGRGCAAATLYHPSSTGSPLIPSSSVDPGLFSPSVFYLHWSTRNRLVTLPPNTSIPTSTPILNKTSGNHSYTSGTHARDSANYRLAQETSGSFSGAMPPQRFLKRFLPIGQDIPVSELEGSFCERFKRK